VPEGLCPECLFQQALAGPGAGPDGEEESRIPSPKFVPPAPAELAGHFPQLEILELVGQGGMGAVYKARQTKLDRLVALKVLPPQVARDPTFAERFTREARSLARLNHPNIVTVFDFGETHGLYYFTMEFVDGKNVRELLHGGALTPAQALGIIPQVCDALQYAHDEGVVHRDIKPENILVDRKGRVKIADFGLAKLIGLTPTYLTLTGTHEVMGTLHYMAPEQMTRSHTVDHRADIYSLGVVFYEMLTGELPLGRFAPPSHKSPVDGRLDPIILRALAREPENRYQDVSELKTDVAGATLGAPAPVQAARPARAGVSRSRVSVRFTIPDISWLGTSVRGQIHRDEEALILEYERINWWMGTVSGGMKEARIPLREVASLSLENYNLFGRRRAERRPRLSRWWNWGGAELVIQTFRLSTLGGLPAGSSGRGRLLIDPADLEAANQLVASVTGPSYTAPSKDLPGRTANPETAGMELTVPAVGLFLTAIVGLLTFIALLAEPYFFHHNEHYYIFVPALLPVALAVSIMLIGAVRMTQLRSYPLAVAATVLALVPWSPGWLLGLPFGMWAFIVLRRPEVMQAFANQRHGAGAGGPATPTGPVGGKIGALFRSVARCFITLPGEHPASSGPQLARRDGSEEAPLPNPSPLPGEKVDAPAKVPSRPP
jgi:serine/threonine protein kinase